MPITLRWLLVVLTVWRLSHLLSAEDGPGDVVLRLRRLAGASWAGRAMDCFYCLSLWVAAPLALAVTQEPLDWALCWLGSSGAACLLERVTDARPAKGDPP